MQRSRWISLVLIAILALLLNAGIAGVGAAPLAQPARQAGTTTFAVIGDYGMDDANEAAVANLVASWSPAFVIATGDDYYSPAGGTGTGKYDESTGAYYCNFLKDISTTGSRCPVGLAAVNAFFPSMGNHDYSDATPAPDTYLTYFTLPGVGFTNTSGNERYYDFVEGPIHFFVLNSNSQEPGGTSSTSTQGQWLQAQLAASTSPWNIVYDHHPPYSSDSSHGSSTYMQWPFAAWGADVVISGHAHTYERILANGIVYFVNGIGGAAKYAKGTTVAGSQFFWGSANPGWGAQKVTATDTTLDFEFYTTDGTLRDTQHLSAAPPTPPAAPSNLGAMAISSSRINLAWTDNADDEDGFKIERSPDGVNGCPVATVGANVTSFSDTGLAANTPYYYQVRAYNGAGDSAYSNIANATTFAPPTPPAAPSNLTATAASTSQIDLAWTDNADNEDGFKIERSPDGVNGWAQIATVGANVTTYFDNGLTPGTPYYYRVRANNAGGDSAYSNTTSATALAPALDAHRRPGRLQDGEQDQVDRHGDHHRARRQSSARVRRDRHRQLERRGDGVEHLHDQHRRRLPGEQGQPQDVGVQRDLHRVQRDQERRDLSFVGQSRPGRRQQPARDEDRGEQVTLATIGRSSPMSSRSLKARALIAGLLILAGLAMPSVRAADGSKGRPPG